MATPSTFVFRPVESDDHDELVRLAFSVNGALTNLPKDREALGDKIQASLQAFRAKVREPSGESYLFVLEDTTQRRIVGVSGILARVGGFDPWYSFTVREEPLRCAGLGIDERVRVLHLTTSHKGPTEVCSLFMDPAARGGGHGRLLSLGRFLFMAAFPQRFAHEVLAEMRGYTDEAGRSPFWEALGRSFFRRELVDADLLCGRGSKDFIRDLAPRHPLYVHLLPPPAQAALGRVHADTQPALRLLASEGFRQNGEVDIFDAGPLVQAALGEIRTIRLARTARLADDAAPESGSAPLALVARPSLDFRAVISPLTEEAGALRLPASARETLRLQPGDPVLWAPALSA